MGHLYNPRGLELILRNKQNVSQHYILPLNQDPRRWRFGTATSVNVSVHLPTNVAPGTYNLYLNLPDPTSSLHNNPAYSIQLANMGIWDPQTGYNSLQASLQVTQSSTSTESG